MWVIISIIVLYIAWAVYKKNEQKKKLQKPENVITQFEFEAENRILSIMEDKESGSEIRRPMPDILIKLKRIKSWYNRVSEIDKHEKPKAINDAEDFRDAVYYIDVLHTYYQKCNFEVDENDGDKLDELMPKLMEIEKRWANKLEIKNIEKYWKEEQLAKEGLLKNN